MNPNIILAGRTIEEEEEDEEEEEKGATDLALERGDGRVFRTNALGLTAGDFVGIGGDMRKDDTPT